MRKLLITAALAASTMAIAGPAAAQWRPAPQPYYGNNYQYNYGYPQGNGYGYYNNYGQVRSMQARIDQIQRQIQNMDRRNILSNREARSLMYESYQLENRLRYTGRNGLNYNESRDIQYRIARLEQRVYREARDGNQWRDNRWGNRDGRIYNDRDRDGRDDRYEDDHGWRHD